jgi:hypothetical protein
VIDLGTGDPIEYRLRLRLPNGRALRPVPFFTRRPRRVGDLVKLPVRADGELSPGEPYDWRVAAVEVMGNLLVLEFVRAAAA